MELSEIIPKRVVYILPGMEHALIRPDIIYKPFDGLDLRMDIYYPSGLSPHANLPAVLFIHGDGPSDIVKNVKDWGQYASWGQLVAASGFIAVTFNHRCSDGKLSRMVDVAGDVQDLIHYVRSHAEELNIDKNSLCVWACSSGVPYLQVVMENPQEDVRCLVAYYGMMDFQQFADGLPADMANKERERTLDIFIKFSLLAHLKNHPDVLPPMFIAQAGLDDPFVNASIDHFIAEAANNDIKVDFVHHPAGQHAFDVLDDDEISRKIIQQTLRFIQEHLRS
jgi:acetyl esterase/lipase